MARVDRSLAIDIGSSAVRVCEFEYPPAGGLVLHGFQNVEFADQLSEANRTDVVTKALTEALEAGDFQTNRASICVSGQAAFMRFVNLPPVSEDESRIKQIVEYEAKQNVPFPMNEVIWDYQLLSGADEDLEVMFVVIKHDIVESVIDAVTNVGLRTTMVDFAPASLYNVSRANHIGDSSCSMVLNIGGRCTTLLFLDGQRFFARTIPIGGFSITQQIAKEFSISAAEAETLKRRHGFVALGGAYEEPDSEVAATISKVVRNVMTRLHGEVNRSISVYRTQQKGNKPAHLYLCGGSSTMAFTDSFFSEKLRLEVSYLNPFKIVSIAPGTDVKTLEKSAHNLGECVGVGLRNSLECPVEITLTPDSLKSQQSFSKKKPFIIAGCVVWAAVLSIFIMVNNKTVALYKDTSAKKKANVERLTQIKDQIEGLKSKEKQVLTKFNALKDMVGHRYDWTVFLNGLQLALPQDVWLGSLTRLGSPIKVTPTRKVTAKQKKDNPFARKKEKKDRKLEAGDVAWYDIHGYAAAIPSSDPKRAIFTSKQIAIFEARVQEQEELITSELGGGEGDIGEEVAAALDELRFWGDNTMKDEFLLPEVVLDSLHWSETFSDNPDETRILETKFSEEFRNVTTFRIQVRLEDPISTKR